MQISSFLASSSHSTTRASSMNVVLGLQFDSAAHEDMKKIIMSYLFPNQVLLDIDFDTEQLGVSFIYALCAILLTNYSHVLRTITPASRLSIEHAIWRFLIHIGYSDPISTVRYGGNPLQYLRTPRNRPSCFSDLHSSGLDERGCMNQGCSSWVPITYPLYDGVVNRPQYGGVDTIVDIAAAGVAAGTPCLTAVQDATREMKSVKSIESPIYALFTQQSQNYVQFLSQLNAYIACFFECGFRLTTTRTLSLITNELTANVRRDDAPLVLRVNARSFFLFFTHLPTLFTPPPTLLRELGAESHFCSLLQRFRAEFQAMWHLVRRDGTNRAYSRKLLFKKLMSSLEDTNVLTKQLLQDPTVHRIMNSHCK